MSNFAILMFIFGGCVFLMGLYMFTGHGIGVLTGRPAFKGLKKDEWRNIGKWTMAASGFILILAIVGLILDF